MLCETYTHTVQPYVYGTENIPYVYGMYVPYAYGMKDVYGTQQPY